MAFTLSISISCVSAELWHGFYVVRKKFSRNPCYYVKALINSYAIAKFLIFDNEVMLTY